MYIRETMPGFLFGGGFSGGTMFMSQNLSDQFTVEELLWDLSDGYIGVPLTFTIEEDGWWYMSYHKYFLENGKKTDIHLLGTDSVDIKKHESFKKAFKEGCRVLLEKTLSEVNNENFLKAQKWCSTYVTLQESKFPSNVLKDKDDEFWKTQKTHSSDASIKSVIDEIKETLEKEAKDRDEDKKAVYKWCDMSMNTSVNYSLRNEVKKFCFSN